MTSDTQNPIVAAIEGAEEIEDTGVEMARSEKPRLQIENSNPDRTVSALGNILADVGYVALDPRISYRAVEDQR